MASMADDLEPVAHTDRVAAAVHELAQALTDDTNQDATPEEREEMSALCEHALLTIVDSQMQGWTVVLKAPGDLDLFAE